MAYCLYLLARRGFGAGPSPGGARVLVPGPQQNP